MEVLDSRWRRPILRAVLCLICPTLLIASERQNDAVRVEINDKQGEVDVVAPQLAESINLA
jgi:hypothetical protein